MKAPGGLVGESVQKNLSLKVLLVDERPMVGATTLCWMEFMCRYGMNGGNSTNKAWGGIPLVVFLGDDVQLPPVLDSQVYNWRGKISPAMHGVMVWEEFKHAVTLTKSIRQNDKEQLFRNILSSLRIYTTGSMLAQFSVGKSRFTI